MKILPSLCCMTVLASASASADDYTLFNPVPDDKLRGMSTERPSKTDSAVTVDAGHFLIETSIFNNISGKACAAGDCVKTHEWDLGATTTLRIGLTQSSDFQIIFMPYQDITIKDQTARTREEHQGFGDTTFRFKYNVWGNDGGNTALAVLPFVKIPTSQDHIGNNAVEGGLEFPFAVNLPDDWSINAMTQLNILKDANNSSYFTAYVNSAALGKSFTDKLSGYAELYTYKAAIGGAEWQNTLDFGVAYAVSDNFHVDTGINLGITRTAPDTNWFIGAAYRF